MPEIIYAFDAYCGWCWGISETILQLKANFSDRFSFSAISGGLNIGDRIGPVGDFAAYIEKAMPRVEQMTGAVFSEAHRKLIFNRATILDSRVPAAAFAAIIAAKPETDTIIIAHEILSLNFKLGVDLSHPENYSSVFEKYNVDDATFVQDYYAGKLHSIAEAQFNKTRDVFGTESFPTIVYGQAGQYFPICQGYQNYEALAHALDILHREPPRL